MIYLTPTRLFKFSEEHLYYEVWMLYGVTQMLQRGTTNLYIYNALLESFVVHASTILDFFYKPQINPNEAKAVHYVSDPREWEKVLLPYNQHFKEFNVKRNQWVMHLSYKRLDVKPQDKRWGAFKITEQIRALFDEFLRLADPQLMHPKLYDLQRRMSIKQRTLS